jgi:sec-independent protein translocase protein TatB
MFGFDSAEIAIIAVLALIFIGPKELPKVMRTVGQWVGRIRATARHFTAGIEDMVRQAELQEMENKWREENERIMQMHPPETQYSEPGRLDEMPPLAEAPEPTLPFDERQAGDELPPDKRPLP